MSKAEELAQKLVGMTSKHKTPSHDRGVLNGAVEELRRLAQVEAEHAALLKAISDAEPVLIDWEAAHQTAFQAAAAFRPSYFSGGNFVAHNWVVEAVRSAHMDGQRFAIGLPPIDRSGAMAQELRKERERLDQQAAPTAPQPTGQQNNSIPSAVKAVIAAMNEDSEYAWSWHCNIAMAFVDAGGDPYTANQGAARFMRVLANVEPAHELPSAPAQPAQQEPSEAEMVCAEAYQVVGCLLSDLGLFETEQARKILDNLSEARRVHQDVLPWESAAQHQEPPQQERKPINCWCEACDLAQGNQLGRTRMSLCPECGDKRCPRAKHHDAPCNGIRE